MKELGGPNQLSEHVVHLSRRLGGRKAQLSQSQANTPLVQPMGNVSQCVDAYLCIGRPHCKVGSVVSRVADCGVLRGEQCPRSRIAD